MSSKSRQPVTAQSRFCYAEPVSEQGCTHKPKAEPVAWVFATGTVAVVDASRDLCCSFVANCPFC